MYPALVPNLGFIRSKNQASLQFSLIDYWDPAWSLYQTVLK